MSEYSPKEVALSVDDRSHFAIVAARWNNEIVEQLLRDATTELAKYNAVEDNGRLAVVRVPGAFEIPLAAQKLARSGRYSAIIALGAVIRGETPHFDYIAGSCTDGLRQVMLENSIPVAMGVLTTDTVAQAQERAQSKGAEAVHSVLEMVQLLAEL